MTFDNSDGGPYHRALPGVQASSLGPPDGSVHCSRRVALAACKPLDILGRGAFGRPASLLVGRAPSWAAIGVPGRSGPEPRVARKHPRDSRATPNGEDGLFSLGVSSSGVQRNRMISNSRHKAWSAGVQDGAGTAAGTTPETRAAPHPSCPRTGSFRPARGERDLIINFLKYFDKTGVRATMRQRASPARTAAYFDKLILRTSWVHRWCWTTSTRRWRWTAARTPSAGSAWR